MNIALNAKTKVIASLIVILYITGILMWEHFNGGVVSHYLFANENFPKFSNWWGLLTMPVMNWILLSVIQKRNHVGGEITLTKSEIYAFLGAVLFAIILTISFYLELGIHDYLLLFTFVLALFIPLYKSEYMLGFIIAMAIGFGGVLPLLFGLVLMLIYAIEYCVIRKVSLLMVHKMKN